jgi:hypothetical protein
MTTKGMIRGRSPGHARLCQSIGALQAVLGGPLGRLAGDWRDWGLHQPSDVPVWGLGSVLRETASEVERVHPSHNLPSPTPSLLLNLPFFFS